MEVGVHVARGDGREKVVVDDGNGGAYGLVTSLLLHSPREESTGADTKSARTNVDGAVCSVEKYMRS